MYRYHFMESKCVTLECDFSTDNTGSRAHVVNQITVTYECFK